MTEQRNRESTDQALVTLMTTGSAAEAHLLVAILKDEDIPAVVQGETLAAFGECVPCICVPKALREDAREVILIAQASPTERAVRRAFSGHDQDEAQPPDPFISKMAGVRELPEQQRMERLRELVEEWLRAGVGSARIARYLAAAGISYERACEVVGGILRRDES